MNREIEIGLMLNGYIMEVKDVLENFNEIMNATLGDTITITSSEGTETRKATLQDAIDVYQTEWCNTVELLSEIGIELEEDNMIPINLKVNHKSVYEKLEKYANMAKSNGAISYLEYNDVQIPYKKIRMEDEASGNTSLYLHLDDEMQAMIFLKKDSKYKVVDKTGDMEQSLLVEIK